MGFDIAELNARLADALEISASFAIFSTNSDLFIFYFQSLVSSEFNMIFFGKKY